MTDPKGDAELARELDRELERVADRLRVLGPRLAARARTADPADTADGADGVEEGVGALGLVRQVLRTLAELAADVEGGPRRPVPQLAPYALGDQLLVLGHDLLAVTDGHPRERRAGLVALVDLRRSLP
jgi:hypothetical protein